ncbi:MAG TPA: 30S ribosomal protein S21 [Gammaproteobacteria bacterium]|nr:30S ribosomal protein S21 [Gammaproteobacteria bacterium]
MAAVDVVNKFGSVDSALRKLKRICDRNGLPKELRKREHHVKDSESNRRKRVAAEKRQSKRIQKEQSYISSARKRIRTKIEMYSEVPVKQESSDNAG